MIFLFQYFFGRAIWNWLSGSARDIGPEPPAGFPEAVEITLSSREKLDALGIKTFMKTHARSHVA